MCAMYAPKVDGRTFREYVEWLAGRGVVFLDTETTGLEGEAVEICVLDAAGRPLLDELVRPRSPIPAEVSRISGIRNEDLADARDFDEIRPALIKLVSGRPVLAWNAEFDVAVLRRSGSGVQVREPVCAMLLWSMYVGSWNARHQDWRWWKLADAARVAGVSVPGTLHCARADAELMRRIVVEVIGR